MSVNEICKICGREIRKTSFSRHVNHTHKITLKEYYDKFYKKEYEGICPVCGKESLFNGLNGYRTFCSVECSINPKVFSERMNNWRNTLTEEEIIEIQRKTEQTKLERYGNKHYINPEKISKSHKNKTPEEKEEIKSKKIKTNLEKYGVEHYTNSEKMMQTKLNNDIFAESGKKLSEFYKNQDEKFFEQRTQKMKESKLEKYGDENYVNSEKAKLTNIEKYGVENPFGNEIIQEKIKNTNKEKYGSEFVTQNKEIQEKIKKTNLDRYGCENTFQNEDIKEKIKNTNKEKYGEDSYSKTNDFKNTIKKYHDDKRQEYLNEICQTNNLKLLEYDQEETKFLCNKCNKEFIINNQQIYLRDKNNKEICLHCNPLFQNSETSKEEKELSQLIKENYSNKILENDRSTLRLELDVYLPDINLAFEFNGLYWHSSAHKKSHYHRYKTDLCEKQNIHLIHIYEDDWMFKKDLVTANILKILNVLPILYPNNFQISKISNTTSLNFLNDNSINFDKKFTDSYGLYSNNFLVYVVTLNKNTINNICEISKYKVKDGFNFIFNYLKENLTYDKYYLILDRSWYKKEEFFEGFEFDKYLKEKKYYIINNKRVEDKQEETEERFLNIYDSGSLKYVWNRDGGK